MKIFRSAWFAGICLGGILLLGTPLFIRTPIWVDVTYHDVSARNILQGGVHYRDVFETNLPGMVWVHAVLRPIIGWSQEAIRISDLLVFGVIVFSLSRFAKETGLSLSQCIWLAVPCVLFYLFGTEFIHVQRDGWMLLPATLATWFRYRQINKPSMWRAVAEGLLWGAAVWIKPHSLVPALLVWLASWNRVPSRVMLQATAGIITGLLIAGLAGSTWLFVTGTWSPMWDVLLNWNGEYYNWAPSYLVEKLRYTFTFFPPFSSVHYITIPLAMIGIFRRKPELAARGMLGALYLGWLAQAVIIQKEFDYAHSPPTILALVFLACHRIPTGPIFLVWCLAGSLIANYTDELPGLRQFAEVKPRTYRMVVPSHAILNPNRLKYWKRCWYDDSMELKDKLTFFENLHCCPDWADLQRVGEFLREHKVGDLDLICWHDSTHPLYLWLNVRPGLRYPHVMTAMKFRSKLGIIRSETLGSPAKYVVADLVPCGYLVKEDFPPAPPPGLIDKVPSYFPEWGKEVYPWNQKPVYRAGRYFVFEITHPEGDIVFPLPDAFKD